MSTRARHGRRSQPTLGRGRPRAASQCADRPLLPPLPPPPDLTSCRMMVAGEEYLIVAFRGSGAMDDDVRGPWLLTNTELAVASAAATGRPSREIAAERGVSVHTVENQLASCYRKLGLGSRAELAAWWYGGRPRRD